MDYIKGFKNEDILSQIRKDYNAGNDAMRPVRDKWERQLKMYRGQKKKTKTQKIGDTTVYNIHTALLARLYLSGVETTFQSVVIGNEDIVDNINSSYKTDMESQEMANVKYKILWDTLFFGISITLKKGWDGEEKRSTFDAIDPRLFVPDPQGDYSNGKYRYAGFKQIASRSDLEGMGIDISEISPVKSSGGGYDNASDILHKDRQSEEIYSYDFGSDTNEIYDIFTYFGVIGEKKYCITTGNNNKIILSVKEIPSILEKEEKNPNKIPFPLEFGYYRPQRGLITGRSVPDDTEDVQQAKAIIANLRLDKSMAELYPMYLYNTRMLKNKADLDFGFNKLIAVNPLEGEPLNNAITPLQKDFRADNSYLIDNSLDQQITRSTSIGDMQQGSDTKRRETATTNRLQQSNSDININLTSSIIKWTYLGIARLWYRGIVENMLDGDKKKIDVYNGMSFFPIKISKKDLVIDGEIKITVKLESEITEKRQKEINAFNMSLPILQQSGIPKSSQNFLTRDFLRNLGYDEKKVWVAIPQTPDEVMILQDIQMLNAGIRVMPRENIDIDTALLYLKSANHGLNVEIYKMKLLEMYQQKQKQVAEQEQQAIAQGQEPKGNGVEDAIRNNVVAQAGAGLQNMAQQFTG